MTTIHISNSTLGDNARIVGSMTNAFSWDMLPTAGDSLLDSFAEQHRLQCLDGTRVELLAQLRTWSDNPTSESLCWLNGMAGTGKSTIARTLAETFSSQKPLNATFCFKRDVGTPWNARRFVTTLAAQLMALDDDFAHIVAQNVKGDPTIKDRSLDRQFSCLISQPLRALTNHGRRLDVGIVVDALDECDSNHDAREIIQILSRFKSAPADGLHIKVLITSRPEMQMRLGFNSIDIRYQEIALHDTPEPLIKRDLTIFFQSRLEKIKNDYNKMCLDGCQLDANWAARWKAETLAQMASPLFIFATHLCRFIGAKNSSPDKQLARVLKREFSPQLALVYLPVIQELGAGLEDCDRTAAMVGLQRVIGPVILVEEPLSIRSLATFLDLDLVEIEATLRHFHSIIRVPSNPNGLVRVLHPSLREYLLDPNGADKNLSWVTEDEGHSQIATRCIRILTSGLRKNICNLRDTSADMREVGPEVLERCIPPPLRYACLYWAHHVKRFAKLKLKDEGPLDKFLKRYCLYWLEAMGAIGKIQQALVVLDTLEQLVEPDNGVRLLSLIRRLREFIKGYVNKTEVEYNPLKIYTAARVMVAARRGSGDQLLNEMLEMLEGASIRN